MKVAIEMQDAMLLFHVLVIVFKVYLLGRERGRLYFFLDGSDKILSIGIYEC